MVEHKKKLRDRVPFEYLTPLFPEEKLNIKQKDLSQYSTRILDLFAPIGKGQRGMIVAQPKTGKTVLIEGMWQMLLLKIILSVT